LLIAAAIAVAALAAAVVGWMGKSSSDDKVSQQKTQIVGLQADLSDSEAKATKAADDNKQLTTKAADSDKQLKSAQADLATAKKDLAAATAKAADLQAQVDTLKKQQPSTNPVLNDGQLSDAEYTALQTLLSDRGITALPMADMAAIASSACAVQTTDQFTTVVTDTTTLFTPTLSVNDAAFVVGAAGAMECTDHLKAVLAG
jgi:small-conductance mechanosensitive channel